MRAWAVWLCAACACTQNFGQFEPDGSGPSDGSADVAADVSNPAEGGVDAAVDAPAQESGPIDAAPDVPVACTESGAIQYGGHCYFLVTTAATFAAATTACMNAGAHLVSITTAGEQAAVIVLGTGTERWIGLYRNNGPPKDGTYQWITGESRNGYSAWSPGEPNGTGQCGTLLGTGLWNDEDCSLSLAYVCERE